MPEVNAPRPLLTYVWQSSGPEPKPTRMLVKAGSAVVILLLGACTTSTKLVTRAPDASLMQPCERPIAVSAKPNGNEIDKALVNTTRLLLECSARHDGLIAFENAAPKQ